MKGRQLAIVLVLLAAVGGTAWFLSRRNTASWSNTATSSDARILKFELNDVTQVTIKGGGAELNLVKANDLWTVKERGQFPASFEKVGTLIRKLWELKPVQDVKVGPSQLGRLNLAEPDQASTGGTLVELKSSPDKNVGALLVGKNYLRGSDQLPGAGGGFPAGRYVMARDGANRVFLVSDTLDDIQTKPETWLDREFFKIENPKSISLTGTTPAQTWTLVRATISDAWKLSDAKPGEELDASKAGALATMFANAAFSDVLAADAPVAETGRGIL